MAEDHRDPGSGDAPAHRFEAPRLPDAAAPRLPDGAAPPSIVRRPPPTVDPADLYAPPADLQHRSSGAPAAMWVALWLIVLAAGGIATYAYIDSRSSERPLADPMAEVRSAAVPPPAPPATLGELKVARDAWDHVSSTVPQPPPAIAQSHFPGEPLRPQSSTIPDDIRIFSYAVTYWQGVDVDDPFVEYFVEYDRDTDETLVSAVDRDGWISPQDIYSGGWRYSFTVDGPFVRVPRSTASLEPAPDHRLARTLQQRDVVPNEAVPESLALGSESAMLDGHRMSIWSVELDVIGFADAQPDAFAAWLDRWTHNDDIGPRLVEEGPRQRYDDLDVPWSHEPYSAGDEVLRGLEERGNLSSWLADRAGIVIGYRADGTVALVLIRDPVNGFMTLYQLLSDASTEHLTVSGFADQEDDDDWIDAP